MKWFIASDLHGSAYWTAKMLERFDLEKADRMLLLGDILYHGPRNDLPDEYAPKKVIAALNERRDRILCVRGNCEAEVDQMVLNFPVMADYCILPLETRIIYATHGHVYNEKNLPPMMPGDILLHGHTHLLRADRVGENLILNPGSVSLPKGGNPHTYAILENGVFRILDMDGQEVLKITLAESMNIPAGTGWEKEDQVRQTETGSEKENQDGLSGTGPEDNKNENA